MTELRDTLLTVREKAAALAERRAVATARDAHRLLMGSARCVPPSHQAHTAGATVKWFQVRTTGCAVFSFVTGS